MKRNGARWSARSFPLPRSLDALSANAIPCLPWHATLSCAEMAAGRGTSIRHNLFPPIGDGTLCLPSASGSTASGRPAPQPWILTDDGRIRLGDLSGPNLRLLALPEFVIGPEDRNEAARLGMSLFIVGGGQEEKRLQPVRALGEESGVFRDWIRQGHHRAARPYGIRMIDEQRRTRRRAGRTALGLG